jgi:hypothetical protein
MAATFIDTRFVAASADKYEPLAKDLVATQPDVILAHTTQVAAALQRESRAIPIVFVNVSDPIGSGLVASLARPDGNFTGVLQYEASVVGKCAATNPPISLCRPRPNSKQPSTSERRRRSTLPFRRAC